MTTCIHQTSPQVYARVGGIFYLIIIVAGILGELFVRSTMVVPGDAAATAKHIMASPLLWRIGITGDISGYLPRILGVLLQLAGLSYLINSFSLLLAPDLAGLLSPAILLPALIDELALCLWLLGKGVNVKLWE